jgi:hypothetical protein
LIERVIENWLTSANERQYQIPFCQLLSAEGESVVDISTHHPHEKGKDIVTVSPDGTIKAYQLKAGRIDLRAWHSIKDEINDLVELPVEHPSIRSKSWHQPILVTNGDITPPVLDQIRSKNEAFRRRGLPRLQLVVKGELLKRFERLHGHYLPRKPQDFGRLLKLILQGGANPLDKETVSTFLLTVLPLNGSEPTVRNAERAVASATVMMSYILGGCEAAENHWAVFEGWVMMAAYSLATAEKRRVPQSHPQTSYNLCLLGAQRALGHLIEECTTRQNLVEGNALTDGHFFRYRITLLIGLISAWGLQRREGRQVNLDGDFAAEFVRRHLKESTIWGESAVPCYVLAALFLERHSRQGLAEALISNLISMIAVHNGSDAGGSPGIPNPYYSPEAAVRLAVGLDPTNLENFVSFAYTLSPLIDFLARRWRKQELSRHWYSITRISLLRFEPEHQWQWLTWHSSTGRLVSGFAKEPQKWSELVVESQNVDASQLPKAILRRPEFLPLFLLVFPHRYNRAAQKVLEDWCLSLPF